MEFQKGMDLSFIPELEDAGVQVINSGKAGSDPEIRVRGTNSINGYKPLYVVDGLFNDNINFLNPQDIESMEILKDPSSLAIFGVRGANGVIIITTKKAKEGQTRVNINGSFGFKSITDKIALTDAEGFKLLYNEQLRNEGNPEYNFSDWTGNTNWQDEIFQTGFITTNPYGTTKAFTERILQDVCKADPSLNVALLRYFNPIGAHKSGLIGEDPNGIPNNLMPYIAKVAVGKLEKVHVFGNDYPTPDGTGVRDYIHVVDLARGHVCAIRKLETNCGLFICNLGTGKGYSVLEVLHAFEKACGKQIPYVIDPRRPGDIAECYADPTKAKNELGWVAQYGIEDMCADSWNWQQKNPDGYNTAK